MSQESFACDPRVLQRALEWIRRTQTADIDEGQLAGAIRQMNDRDRAALSARILAPLGEPRSIEYVDQRTDQHGTTTYRFRVTFRAGTIGYVFGLTADGKVAQRSFKPLPGMPGPFDDLLPNSTLFQACMQPNAAQTPQETMDRAFSRVIDAYTKRLEARES